MCIFKSYSYLLKHIHPYLIIKLNARCGEWCIKWRGYALNVWPSGIVCIKAAEKCSAPFASRWSSPVLSTAFLSYDHSAGVRIWLKWSSKVVLSPKSCNYDHIIMHIETWKIANSSYKSKDYMFIFTQYLYGMTIKYTYFLLLCTQSSVFLSASPPENFFLLHHK